MSTPMMWLACAGKVGIASESAPVGPSLLFCMQRHQVTFGISQALCIIAVEDGAASNSGSHETPWNVSGSVSSIKAVGNDLYGLVMLGIHIFNTLPSPMLVFRFEGSSTKSRYDIGALAPGTGIGSIIRAGGGRITEQKFPPTSMMHVVGRSVAH